MGQARHIIKNYPIILRFFIALALFSAATLALYFYLDRPPLGADDALIFFTYGCNVAQGHGLVYNAGEAPVEGFSSPLWMLFVALAHILFARPELPLLVLSLLLISFALAHLWRLVDQGPQFTWRGAFLLAAVLGAPAYTVWMTLTLMDSALWSALLILSAVTVLDDKLNLRRLSILVVLLLLTRPEGMAWAPLFIAIALFRLPTLASDRPKARVIFAPLCSFLFTLAFLVGARLLYFGYPLPNTYYAKVSPDALHNLLYGAAYLRDFLLANLHILLLGLGLAVAATFLNAWPALKELSARRRMPQAGARSKLFATSIIVLAALVMPLPGGGDHFSLFRFYQAPWPLLFLPITYLISLHAPTSKPLHKKNWITTAGAALLIALLLLLPQPSWLNPDRLQLVAIENHLGQRGRRIGLLLNELFPQQPPSLGVLAAGGAGLEYNGKVIDLLGLNNVEMAHAPRERAGLKNHDAFNATVFFRQRPALLLVGHVPDAPYDLQEICVNEAQRLLLKDLHTEQRFWEVYDRVILQRGERRILALIDREYARTLPQKGYTMQSLGCAEAYGLLLSTAN